MHTLELSSWDEFLAELAKLQELLERRRSETGSHVDDLLFRGHADQKWNLETTLERHGLHNYPLKDYFLSALKSKHVIESYLDKRWNFPTQDEYYHYLNTMDTFMMVDYPGYEFFAYLRHCGFPSPLLDWSASPFVAAFFAFEKADELAESARVAIFAFCEFFGAAKGAMAGAPLIQTRGPYTTSHPRHFKQQSSYTICAAQSDSWYYAPHESALGLSEGREQDVLWKFTIPTSERRKVLKYLDAHNLNAYSLFNSEESLMSTLAIRELYLNLPAT